MTQGYGSVKGNDGEQIYIEPSIVDVGGVYLDVDTQSIWLPEKETKKLWKLLKEASEEGLDNG